MYFIFWCLGPDVLICGVCKLQFTSLHNLAQHKKIPCQLRVSTQAKEAVSPNQGIFLVRLFKKHSLQKFSINNFVCVNVLLCIMAAVSAKPSSNNNWEKISSLKQNLKQPSIRIHLINNKLTKETNLLEFIVGIELKVSTLETIGS